MAFSKEYYSITGYIHSFQFFSFFFCFRIIFVVQGFLTSIQDQQASAEGNVATSLIDVYKALGGGWEIRLKDVKPPPPK